MNKILTAVALASILAGCAISQTVRPVGQLDTKQICVIENLRVRDGFQEAYKAALIQKGYAVKVLPDTAPLTACPVTSTYSANWRWDLGMYLSYAQINVYKNGSPIGLAWYDATRGSANMGKFINAQNKIDELVGQLFPDGAGS